MSDSDAASTPQRIHIAGAGAIGCVLATLLAEAGHHVSMLARGETLAAIETSGVGLDDAQGSRRVRVQAAAEATFGVQDILFISAKSQDVPALAAAVRPMIDADTLIVPLLNGVPFWYPYGAAALPPDLALHTVDPDDTLRSLLPYAQILGAVVFITAHTREPGLSRSGTPHRLVLGEPGGGLTPRLRHVSGLLEAAGVAVDMAPRLRDRLWIKIIANITSNLISVVTGTTLSEMSQDPWLCDITRQVAAEVLALAAAHGAQPDIEPNRFNEMCGLVGPVKTSMLQDYERGRPLEIAGIGEAVLELAAASNQPMPATRVLVAITRALGARRARHQNTSAMESA